MTGVQKKQNKKSTHAKTKTSSKKSTKKNTAVSAKKKKDRKTKELSTPKFKIRAGSACEKMCESWAHLAPHKRKLLTQVSDALLQNKTQTKRIRVSLLPKVLKAKRPMTGYMLFAHETHQQLKSENPGLKVTEMAKVKGQKWNTLTPEEQTGYKSRKVENPRLS